MRAFILRRWWLIRNRLMSTIAFALIIPSVLTIITVMGIKNVIIRSINGQPYEMWVMPGLFMFMAAILVTPLIYRDFFDLRIHHKVLTPIVLSPLRKSNIVMGILFSSLLEVIFILIIGLIIYSSIFPHTVNFSQGILTLFYSIIFAVLFGNIIILISLMTERISFFIYTLMMLLITVMFGCGLFIELDFYPVSMGNVLRYLPLSMVGIAGRAHLFQHSFDLFNTAIPVIVSGLLIILNGFVLKRKMRQ
ncbi:MAG: hypothetical protein IIB95_10765 [Candidatus Marinimicrobia bacterium]|nr:hypothetical protein [Candidatus Neomarinimicrobiota bacterium]MCH7764205.1 hypothetical protein [Candidatus Neomarinimicrobiota bacterium]